MKTSDFQVNIISYSHRGFCAFFFYSLVTMEKLFQPHLVLHPGITLKGQTEMRAKPPWLL